MKKITKNIGVYVLAPIVAIVTVTAALCSPIHAATGRDIGIATGTSLLWTDEAALDSRIKDIQGIGATWVRMEFNWAEIQPESADEYKWAPYDRVVTALRSHDIGILATLVHSPPWARSTPCAALVDSEEAERKCSPQSNHDFAVFAKAAASRYDSSGVYTWEIWNEPNLTGHWKTVKPNDTIFVDAAAYARTANAAANAIRKEQPRSFIVTGGLAPVYERGYSRGIRQSDYLRQLLPRLDSTLFNAVGIHPYSWPNMPRLTQDYNAFYTVDNGGSEYSLRAIMDGAGWHDKQLWATEFGASTKGKRLEGAITLQGRRPDHVSERKQARILEEGVELWHTKTRVGPLFVHSDSDRWLMYRGNEHGYGLRRTDGTKKPSYEALHQAIRQLR